MSHGKRPSRRAAAWRPGIEVLEDRITPSAALVRPGAVAWHPALGARPLAATGPSGITPAQMRHAYGFDQVRFQGGAVPADGRGQTIAIVDAYDDPNIQGDLHAFDVQFGLPDPPSFQKVSETGGTTSMPPPDTRWALEIALDVEWAHVIAPGANILLVEGNGFAGADYARHQPGVVAVSMSWTAGPLPYRDDIFTTPAGHGGVTFFAASGDSGAAANWPAASAHVVGVGGTTLHVDSAGNYLGESGWSGSGGGLSSYVAQPAYQQGVVTQSGTQRGVPDVAFDADPSTGVPVYNTYGNSGWVQVGGTSASAPQWAGLMAVVDQGRALAGLGSLDGATQTLPMLYRLPSADFHDVTTGSNGFAAGPGYDLVTGRGSPVANRLVYDLVGVPAPSAPTNLAAAAGDGRVSLTWSASAGATAYNVYRRAGSGTTLVLYRSGVTGTSFLDTNVTNGTTYFYSVSAVNVAGESARSAEVQAQPHSAAVVGTGTGLTGQYFRDTNLGDLALTRTDATVNFTWPDDTAPAAGLPADNWSVKWTGQVQAQYSETYTFSTVSDDGVRVFVNGQFVIDDWTYHAAATDASAGIALQAGQKYSIEMDYFEGYGAATAQLQWSSPSTPLQVIPTTQLYAAGVPVNLAGAFNRAGIVNDGTTFGAGFDGDGTAWSAGQLGSTITWGGQSFALGAPGQNDVVQAQGQTIALPAGRFSALLLLADAVNGNQAGLTFTVRYTDGTTQTFTQSVSDWYTPQNYAGESTAASTGYRDLSDGSKQAGPFYVYGYRFALDPTKVVQAITLPNDGHLNVLAVNLLA